jgi:hypothetical protein
LRLLARKPANWISNRPMDGWIERDYVRDSLVQTGLVLKTDYMTPADPVLTAKTATGSEFTSDGRTLLVYLAPLPK